MTDVAAGQAVGREAVEQRLIDATSALLAETGPTRVTVRDIADRAGVNKGQIHHYFGGKQGLIEATVRQLAKSHYANATERAGGPIPVPLTLSEDQRYMQALVRIVVDGDLHLAALEMREGISVPIRGLSELAGGRPATSELLANFAAAMTIELGWAAFRDYIIMVLEASADEVEGIENELRQRIGRDLETR